MSTSSCISPAEMRIVACFRRDSRPAHPRSGGGQQGEGDGPLLPPPPSAAGPTGALARPLDPKRRRARGDHEHAAGRTRGGGGA